MHSLANQRPKFSLSDSLLLGLSLLITWGAVIYYLYALNWPGINITIFLSALSFYFCKKNLSPLPSLNSHFQTSGSFSRKYFYALVAYFLTAAGLLALLLSSRSDQALISPWETVPALFFVIYGAGLILLSYLITRPEISRYLKLSLISLHYFITLSVAAIVYIIGYGFDPFIHVATMDLIIELGAVSPKPLYYLGQYSLLVTIAKLTGLAIESLNRFLVPVAAALLLPLSLLRNISANSPVNRDSSSVWLVLIFLPIITFSPFILTTPQNLSYVFLILTVLAGSGQADLKYTLLLAAATTAIHPLTGLPALAWFLFLVWHRYRPQLRSRTARITGALLFVASTLALPLALALATGASFKLQTAQYFRDFKDSLGGFNSAGQEDVFLNTSYFLAENLAVFLVLLVIASIIYGYKKIKYYQTLFTIELALLLSYLLSRGLEFNSLIDYEQLAYASRIPIIMIIFALPFVLYSVNSLILSIKNEPRFRQTAWLALAIIMSLTSLYISYPRFDKYWNSRGYSTSANDLEAVREIAKDANQPYVALANQQVSAAALKELGFDNYHKTAQGEIYTYPIPTGGPLYEHYLSMVYDEPTRSTASKAASLAGVDLSYLVVNKYWYQSGQIINAAKISADKWWDISGEIFIFKYQF